jgi:hypothetical protein
MIRCDTCRTLNEDNARSCIQCGTSLWLSGRAPSGDISRMPAAQEERRPAYTPPVNPYAPPAVQPAPHRPQAAGYRCPYCQSPAPPFAMQKISDAGWIVFAVMLIFCFPLFWVGLLMKQDELFCSTCRARLN